MSSRPIRKVPKVSKSARIRAFYGEGHSIREAADKVGVGYHHAYSVLYQAGLVGKSGDHREPSASPDSGSHSTERVKLAFDASGGLNVPEPLRRAMGVRGGSSVLARVVDGELRIITPEMAIERAQKLVRELIPGNDSLADSLIADRRKEAAREANGE